MNLKEIYYSLGHDYNFCNYHYGNYNESLINEITEIVQYFFEYEGEGSFALIEFTKKNTQSSQPVYNLEEFKDYLKENTKFNLYMITLVFPRTKKEKISEIGIKIELIIDSGILSCIHKTVHFN